MKKDIRTENTISRKERQGGRAQRLSWLLFSLRLCVKTCTSCQPRYTASFPSFTSATVYQAFNLTLISLELPNAALTHVS